MTEKEIGLFWNANLCGSWFIKSKYPTKEFFQEYINYRYTKEHHIKKIIDFKLAKGKKVLDIGLGVGADALNWAKHADLYTGIDLTEAAVKSTQTLFKLKNIKNGQIFQGDVVKGFDNIIDKKEKYDIIYSHGVLHHTSSLNTSLINLREYLSDNGELIIMLYTKNSFNYWFRIQFYFRIKFIISLLKRNFGINLDKTWSEHIANYDKIGKSYFSWSNWPHRCTDGANCEVANIYSTKKIREILKNSGYKIYKMRKAHLPFTNGKIPKLERLVAKYLGFYQFIFAKK